MNIFFLYLLVTIILLIISGWLAAIIGNICRYLYFGIGTTVGYVQEVPLGYKILMIIILWVFAFIIFNAADKRMKIAASHVPSTVTLSMSAFFIGSIIGFIVYLF